MNIRELIKEHERLRAAKGNPSWLGTLRGASWLDKNKNYFTHGENNRCDPTSILKDVSLRILLGVRNE